MIYTYREEYVYKEMNFNFVTEGMSWNELKWGKIRNNDKFVMLWDFDTNECLINSACQIINWDQLILIFNLILNGI